MVSILHKELERKVKKLIKHMQKPIRGFWHMTTIQDQSGAPNKNIVQNHLNIALLNVF